MSLLNVEKLSKKFGEIQVLDRVDLTVDKGEFVAIMGQSGSGKSTLLYCISGMDDVTSGHIRFESEELTQLNVEDMQKLRLEKMGFIFQKTNFLKNLSVEDNIVFPAFQLAKRKRKDILKDMIRLMEQMGISDLTNRAITQVSGGQLQRAAICRAMINHPDILFGDELTGALNSSATKDVMDIITNINQEGTTIFLVIHDAKVALRADRIIYLEDGNIKDTLILGKYNNDDYLSRETVLKKWLDKMGF